ncbi:hypothetical protein Avbf_16974 [Armadillidium vulgare]|nr:hypothetical protein Avbf_16974 [Armadillidium vulgare]
MDYELKYKESEGPETPVMSPYTSFPPRLVLSFVTGCEDDFCRSDLVSTAMIKDFDLNSKIVIGKASKIVLKVETVNKREPAFLPNITINIPKPIIVLPSIRDCSTEQDEQTTSLVCQLKNPLRKYEKSATDFEENPDDNKYILNLPVEKNASISVSGYLSLEHQKSEQAPISKSGFTPLRNVQVEILVPRNVTLPTGETVTVIRELEVKVLNFKSQVCSLYESNKQMMFHEPKTKAINESVNDRRSSLSTLSCLKGRWGYVNCSTIKCSLGPWKKGNDVSQLSITFKVNFTTLGQLVYSKEIQAHFIPGSVPAQPLALWIYIVAILCGLLLLLIIVFILYKEIIVKERLN